MSRNALLWLVIGILAVVVILAVTTPAQAVNKKIGAAELVQLQSGGAWLIDVRSAGEFSGAHIPGAVNVPIDQLPQAAASWNKQQPIIVYCATGARSANAAAYLAAQGFRKVYDLSRGLTAWNGQLTSGGQTGGSVPTGPGTVKTNGKPVFIDFASST